MNNVIDIEKYPSIHEMIETLIPVLLLVHDKYCKRRVSRIVNKNFHTLFDYVHVCTYYELYIKKHLYSINPEEEARFKRQRHAERLRCTYKLYDFSKKNEMGLDYLYYKDVLLTKELEHEDTMRLMISLHMTMEKIRSTLIKELGERYELTRKTASPV